MQGEYSQLRTQLRPAVGIVAAVGIKTKSLVWCIVTALLDPILTGWFDKRFCRG